MNNLVLNIWVKVQNLRAAKDGQDVVEYALVFAVIALGAAAGMSSLAGGIDTEFVNISTFIGNYTT
jgi:Flp pilus assembly pilin Flp